MASVISGRNFVALTKKVDWLPDFFSLHADRIKRILPASGCRELWLQGEIYLYLSDDGLLTNATQSKYDLYMEGGFVMELKLLGGDYQRKVLSYLNRDFEKLQSHVGKEQKYVLLVLDNRCQSTRLYGELFNYKNELGRLYFYQDYGPFCVLLWRMI
jgi:hypothetical protein